MQRKLMMNGSMVVIISNEVCNLNNFKNGDIIEILPIGVEDLRLREI